MRYLILVAVVGALAGCGTSPVDQAVAACEAFGWSRSEVEVLIAAGQLSRDAGATRDEMRDALEQGCLASPPETQDDCLVCIDAIINAVYSP